MLLFEEYKNAKESDIISSLFFSRDTLHIFHLRTKSFASHKASQEYYDAIVGLIDSLIEELQGEILQILHITQLQINVIEDEETLISYLKNLDESIKLQKGTYSTSIQNIFDEISSLINGTIYKLNFLK